MGKERDRCLQVIVVAQRGDGDLAGAARTAKGIQQDDFKVDALDARLLLSQGQSLRAVSRRLGHARPEMTLKVYAHCLPSDDAQLAACLSRMMA